MRLQDHYLKLQRPLLGLCRPLSLSQHLKNVPP